MCTLERIREVENVSICLGGEAEGIAIWRNPVVRS